jgi:hypothetical protein
MNPKSTKPAITKDEIYVGAEELFLTVVNKSNIQYKTKGRIQFFCFIRKTAATIEIKTAVISTGESLNLFIHAGMKLCVP